nr:hypothetical protein [Tanacetum cinerariifolium]
MRFWFVQETAKEGLLKFLHDRCDDLRRKNAKHRVLIREMEALGEHGVPVDSLESLKQTHARETAKLAALTDAITESLAGIHEKERHSGTNDATQNNSEKTIVPFNRGRRGKDNDEDNSILYPYLGEVAIWSQPWRTSGTTSDVAGLSLLILFLVIVAKTTSWRGGHIS